MNFWWCSGPLFHCPHYCGIGYLGYLLAFLIQSLADVDFTLLRSAGRHQLTVPRHRLSTYGRQAFAVADPTMFNTLPDDLRDPAVSTSTFRQSLKTHLFSAYQHI